MRSLVPDRRGFVPVAGTSVLVAVVALVLTVVGAGVFGLVDDTAPPEASFEVESTTDGVVVTALGPDAVPATELSVHREAANETVSVEPWPETGVVSTGDQATLAPTPPGEELTVVWEPTGFAREETLARYDPERDAGSELRDAGSTPPTRS
jgi:FlaG/FlaF family flagellin (archaellin)